MREGRPALIEDLLAVCDEQESIAGQPRAQSGVVDRGHDGLAGTGRRDEEIAMVSERACQRDLLEQSLLKRVQHDLDRTEEQWLFVLDGCGPVPELVVVEGNEVAACPVRLEDGRHLGDDVRVAHA